MPAPDTFTIPAFNCPTHGRQLSVTGHNGVRGCMVCAVSAVSPSCAVIVKLPLEARQPPTIVNCTTHGRQKTKILYGRGNTGQCELCMNANFQKNWNAILNFPIPPKSEPTTTTETPTP